MAEAASRAAESAARHSYGRLLAFLTARTRDVAGAEDALADAFAAALAGWPKSGVPDRPEAWLVAVARRKLIDNARRRQTGLASADHLKLLAEEAEARMTDDAFPDERLALMFACAHPAIDPGIRAPLILQTVLGLDAAAIGGAFLVSPATMAQRLVRAKLRIRETGIGFRVPDGDELDGRLDAVLSAIYAAFSEGWTDPAGEDRRSSLSDEAIWLGRLVARLMPAKPEARGLLALMLYAEGRRHARRTSDGDYVPLAEQDVGQWDGALMAEADAIMAQAGAGDLGRTLIEAAIQSVHAARRFSGRTDWAAIRTFYDALCSLSTSPVVAINRAMAIAETEGETAGLAALDAVAPDRRVAEYQPYFAARAQLLSRLERWSEAAEAYRRAIGLERDPAVRRFLEARIDALAT